MAVPRQASSYRPDIDGLRAIAVLLVLVFHFKLAHGMGEAGFIGVDIFFVISGYLITGLLVRDLEHGQFSLAAFYVHRARRLAPALIATLAASLAYAWWRLLPHDFAELVRQLVATQWYAANFYYWQHIGYFGLGVDRAPLLHTWSLAVEEQFYLLYPLFLMALFRWRREWLWSAIVLGLLGSFALNLGLVATKPNAAFYLLPTRAWELLTGALLCQLGGRWRPHRRQADVLGLTGLLCIGAALQLHHPGLGVPGWFATLPVLGAAALLQSGSAGAGAVHRLLSSRPMVYVGHISYPAYLVHWPLHVFASIALGQAYGQPERWTIFTASLVLAAGVYHWVEQPIRRGRLLPNNRHFLGIYAITLAVSVPLLLASQQSRGLPARFPDQVIALDNAIDDRVLPMSACEGVPLKPMDLSSACHLGAQGVRLTWLVYGDSHALAAHGAFDEWLRRRGEAGYFYFRHGCPPVMGLHVVGDGGACNEFNNRVMEHLANTPDINAVVMVSTWLQAQEGILSATPSLQLSPSESLRLFATQFDLTLRHLNQVGKKVVVWEPVPGAKASVPQALAMAALDGQPPPALEWTRAEYLQRYRFFFEALDAHSQFISARISPSDAICATGACEVQRNGRPLYSDNSHVAASSREIWQAALGRVNIDSR